MESEERERISCERSLSDGGSSEAAPITFKWSDSMVYMSCTDASVWRERRANDRGSQSSIVRRLPFLLPQDPHRAHPQSHSYSLILLLDLSFATFHPSSVPAPRVFTRDSQQKVMSPPPRLIMSLQQASRHLVASHDLLELGWTAVVGRVQQVLWIQVLLSSTCRLDESMSQCRVKPVTHCRISNSQWTR